MSTTSTRIVKLTMSGSNSNDATSNKKYHDGVLKCRYNYIFDDYNADTIYPNIKTATRMSYGDLAAVTDIDIVALNYQSDDQYDFTAAQGLGILNSVYTTDVLSYFRREYDKYKSIDSDGNEEIVEYKGEWQPVAINYTNGSFRDFNISNDRLYQYICYTQDSLDATSADIGRQLFANYNESTALPESFGEPVYCKWGEWSIVELQPISTTTDAPVVKQTYKANVDQMWLFRYELSTGAQTQNISRNDVQMLGQYNRVGYGASNYISGEVTALMGSEIIPWNKQSYTERLWRSRENPLSTNEKVKMLQQWRQLVASKNPKLLKDMKGQSWIVQIISSSNTPKTGYFQQPDSISFQWRQIESTDNVVIYGDPITISKSGCSTTKTYVSLYRNPSNQYAVNGKTKEWTATYNDRGYNSNCNCNK